MRRGSSWGDKDKSGWSLALDKIGQWIDPSQILINGSRTLHSIGDGGAVFSPPAAAGGGGSGEANGGGSSSASYGKVWPHTQQQQQRQQRRQQQQQQPRVTVTSPDAGLVSPGKASENMDLYTFPGALPDAQDGIAVSLWNNLWNCVRLPVDIG
jgi:hypothetical protein